MYRRSVAAAILSIAVGLLTPVLATDATANAATVLRIDDLSATRAAVFIDSPAMGRTIQVQVLHPADGGARPTYYLLDGLDPGAGQSTWTNATDAEPFFRDKNVNVVLPMGGQASYYTDWINDDPKFGRYKWETFLTRELPPIIDGHFAGNGVNAIGGLSMGGNAAFTLAVRRPDLYQAVAGYSACPDTTIAQGATMFSIANRGGNPLNMWGAPTDPEWAAHNPALLAERLRGKTIYLSTGSGLPGPHELEIKPQLPENLFFGGPIESGVNACVVSFEGRLRQLGIPARIDHSPVGTHSWSYWQDTLHTSWPTIAGGIGA
ncbi:alpha/beta hydrolase [Nocardia sp. NPDC050406]|uniref:alpha/beta hydrolase n=1 Tax=Nocardia sp. NPDC050406 TaxID=3364318 RepID=UPI0037A5D53E